MNLHEHSLQRPCWVKRTPHLRGKILEDTVMHCVLARTLETLAWCFLRRSKVWVAKSEAANHRKKISKEEDHIVTFYHLQLLSYWISWQAELSLAKLITIRSCFEFSLAGINPFRRPVHRWESIKKRNTTDILSGNAELDGYIQSLKSESKYELTLPLRLR